MVPRDGDPLARNFTVTLPGAFSLPAAQTIPVQVSLERVVHADARISDRSMGVGVFVGEDEEAEAMPPKTRPPGSGKSNENRISEFAARGGEDLARGEEFDDVTEAVQPCRDGSRLNGMHGHGRRHRDNRSSADRLEPVAAGRMVQSFAVT